MQRSMKLLLFQEIIFEGSTSHKKKKSRKIFEVQITITKEKAHIFCVLVRRQLVKRKKKKSALTSVKTYYILVMESPLSEHILKKSCNTSNKTLFDFAQKYEIQAQKNSVKKTQ